MKNSKDLQKIKGDASLEHFIEAKRGNRYLLMQKKKKRKIY